MLYKRDGHASSVGFHFTPSQKLKEVFNSNIVLVLNSKIPFYEFHSGINSWPSFVLGGL